uniref:Uncharacterized protein n=1 Tax=Micrurus surinamensis TaxID=129470 RepID=A0A2D4P6H5_MICSU
MLWVNGTIGKDTYIVEIIANIWADHNPLKIVWKGQKKRRMRWTLNLQILKEKEYNQRIKNELETFFKINLQEHTNLQNLWDTTKAYMRGISIAYTIRKNKTEWKQQNELQKKVKELENGLQKDPKSNDGWIQIKFDIFIGKSTKFKIYKAKL